MLLVVGKHIGDLIKKRLDERFARIRWFEMEEAHSHTQSVPWDFIAARNQNTPACTYHQMKVPISDRAARPSTIPPTMPKPPPHFNMQLPCNVFRIGFQYVKHHIKHQASHIFCSGESSAILHATKVPQHRALKALDQPEI